MLNNKPIIKKVKSLQFLLLSPEQIKKIATAKIVTPELYDVDGYPVDGGLMDLRLGAIDPGVRCRTCGGRLKECLGHHGLIELARPVLHIKYIPIIELFLRCYCQSCNKLLLSEENVAKYPNIKQRIKKAKDVKKCPHCSSAQEKVKIEKPTTFKKGKKRIFANEIRDILSNIPDEEIKLVGMNPKHFRPEWGILTVLLVPPVTVRPSITLESGERSEDDLTHKLSDIIRANQRLWENLNAGAPEVIIDDLWDLLQYHITSFFDNSIAGIPPARHRSGQPLKTITERIKGKEGRIRHNLAGKRVNYSSRTVISPDPYLNINEVGVPLEIAEILTVNERVNSNNIEMLKELIRMGGKYPGANYVIRPDGRRKKITEDLKEEIIEEIQPGYFVERHLQDGDIVLFNRHPSLHKPSLMAHFVRVLPYKTFRLHPAAAPPYNADFDGDEMNVHSPQGEEARAEAKTLLDVNQNLISPKNNSNLIGCIADAVTGNYLLNLSQLSKGEASQMLYQSDVETSFSKKVLEGNEVISEVLPKIDFEAKSKSCLGEDCPHNDNCKKDKCPYGSYLSIKEGKLITGAIDDNVFGVEDGMLIKSLDKVIGRTKTMDTIKNVFSLGTKFLSREGFTISISDLNVNQTVKDSTNKVIKDAEDKTDKIIESYENDSLETIPGKTKSETREIKILQALNEIRTKIGSVVKNEIPKENPVNTMITSGAGGNVLNITQMACCVGQQSLWSKRIDIGFSNRTLSFFKEGDLSPKARGFIYSPFIKGLRPYEFFFGSMTGRDGLMDTALRTPKSGYLYRRLANALQDLKIEYDGTVRDASQKIIQFKYGEDGLDVSGLHKGQQIASGEAIGIVTAQSFGEPSTQMALNVFHFAGVQEMQVTKGLPRIIEIFDARKKPSTPAMEIFLEKDYNNEKEAKKLAEKILETKLKDVADEIKIDFGSKKIEVVLNVNAVKSVHTGIAAISEKLNDKGHKNKVKGNVLVFDAESDDFKEIYKLKEKLKITPISGVKNIAQILVVKREKDFVVLTSGTNMKDIIQVKGIDIKRTTSNDVHEMNDIFGVEVARATIIKEIEKVIVAQGLDIDKRHLMLIADAMTNTGEVKGVTRMGIIAQKSSILARASFETPIKHFVNSTLKGGKDELASVVENIILNQPVPVGTGLPGLVVKVTGSLAGVASKKKTTEKVKKVKK